MASTNPDSTSKWWRTSNRPEYRDCSSSNFRWKMTESRSRLAYSRLTGREEVASTLLVIDSTGVIPLPAQKAMIGPTPSRTQKLPDGGLTSTTRAGDKTVDQPVGDGSARHPLDGEGEVAVGVRGARHRVAPGDRNLPQRHPERAELAGPVGEGLSEVLRHLEHEGPCLLGLVHHLGDRKGVIPVPPDDGLAPGQAGRPRTVWMGPGRMEAMIALYENHILSRGPAMPRPRTPQPPTHLVSARMVDIVGGTLIEPGNLLIDGDRIVGVSPDSVPPDATEIDLGDVTLLPGLMDMEVNLVMGGPNHSSPLIPVQEDPALRTLRAAANARRTLRAGFTTVRNLGSVRADGRNPARRGADEGHRHGLVRRAADRPGRTCHQPDGRPSGPHHVPGLRPPRPVPYRRRGDRQRHLRGAEGRPLPDQVRGPGHQGQRVRRA